MKRVILTLLLLIIIAAVAGSIYLNKVFLPVKLKGMIAERASALLGRTVTLEGIGFSFVKGLTLRGVTIAEKGPGQNPFFSCGEASATVLYLPILKERKIIASSITIRDPRLSITREGINAWNFSDLLAALKTTPSATGPAVLVKTIVLANGTVSFTDRSLAEPFSEKIENLDTRIRLSLDARVAFSARADITGHAPKQTVSVDGTYAITSRELTAHIKTQHMPLTAYLAAYGPPRTAIVRNAQIASADIALTFKEKTLKADVKLKTKDVHVAITSERHFYGNPVIDASFSHTFGAATKPQYSGTAECNGARFTGMPRVDAIEDIAGTVAFTPRSATTSELAGTVDDIPCTLSGHIGNFSDPLIDATVSFATRLEKISELFPEIAAKANADIQGNADCVVSYDGPVQRQDEANISVTAQIKDATLKINNLADAISDISGNVECKPNFIGWKDLQATYKGVTYTAANGTLENFSQPLIKTSLASSQLNCNVEMKKTNTDVNIRLLKGTYLNSAFDITGAVFGIGVKSPYLELGGSATLALADLATLAPHLKQKLENIKPAGSIAVRGSVRGDLKNWKDLHIFADGTSPKITLKEYALQDVKIKFTQKNRLIEQCDITANAYGGILALASEAALTYADTPYKANLTVENINLAKLKKDTTWHDKDISGLVSLATQLEGIAEDRKTTRGTGSLSIQNGHIWQMTLFEGLGKFLFIPEYRDITFREAQGTFIIENEKVKTDDFKLISKPVNLECHGSVDFTGKLNFTIFSKFSPDAIQKSSSLKKTITAILTQGEEYLTIRVSGTLQKPSYYVVPASVDVQEKLKTLIRDGIDSIFE